METNGIGSYQLAMSKYEQEYKYKLDTFRVLFPRTLFIHSSI